MRFAYLVFVLSLCFSSSLACAAQSPSNNPTASPTQPAPSAILQPSLDTVQQTVTALKLDKWKKGTVRDEAGEHVAAILKDLQSTLPPLLAESDAPPQSISKVFTVSRNVDALYAVLLRVVEAARVSAPADQVTQLEQALVALSTARHTLDDRLQDSTAALEKQLGELQTTLKAQAAKAAVPPVPPVQPCPAPAPVRKPRKKPAPAKPPQTPPAEAPKTQP